MEMIKRWMTKKNIAIIGLVSTAAVCFLFQMRVRSSLYDFCMNWNLGWGDLCINSINFFDLILLIGVAVFVPILVMFFMKEKIFELWKGTLSKYIYIYIAILIFVPWDAGDAYLHIEKDLIAILASVIYVIFSVFYIIYKNHQLKSE